jgi:DNA-binding transcriptional LysR family regulator
MSGRFSVLGGDFVGVDQLVLFRDIVREKSISKGATLSGISQSAASQQIRELEERLGVTLLDRSTRPFAVTVSGKLYYELCRDVLQRNEEFMVALEALKKDVEGTVRVASIYSVGITEMSHLKAEFSHRCPQARLEVEYLRPDKVYERLLADRADFGFVSYPRASKELAVLPWRQEEMAVAAAPSHPLAGRRMLSVGELNGQDFVAFDEELPIRHEIDHFLRERGIEVNLTMHFDNIQSVKEAVALGSGISILPVRPMQAEIDAGRLIAIPIDAALVRPVGIIHRRRRKFHRAAGLFLELLAEQPREETAAK